MTQKETDHQGDRPKMIATLVRTCLSEPDKDKLIQELQESRYNEYTLLSDKAKAKIHSPGNHEFFELCVMSEKIQCARCLRYSTHGKKYCRCGTIFKKEHEGSEECEFIRELNHRWFGWLTIPNFTLMKGARRGARHGPSQAQIEFHQARNSLGEALKRKFKSIHHRFMTNEEYRSIATECRLDGRNLREGG